ncbi:hypothetical protein K5V21_02810 [Clostridium sardiniense]|uniref:SinR family protein n=1 Tax=Clostridium sardiniense TaxID=29369 RepID=A0ABS7KU94_CLOSR|nr:hypothetical protein [Clostridium sardiniense]MBY0754379.1 hypothetical protein [Clostridium sardiniense]MDQ0461253.1 hypothetical protein [Clostridium sardiniense]
MSVYMITYHLNHHHHHDEDSNLTRKIKSLGSWAQIMPSSWLVYSEFSAKEINDSLKEVIEEKDLLFVSEINKNHSGSIDERALSWIDRNLNK